jgi:mRNA-degrading endonuclease toxin of MazEF toxin-antitoxin module
MTTSHWIAHEWADYAGELAEWDQTVMGTEQAGRRPVVVVWGPRQLMLPHSAVFVMPVTSRDRGLRHQIPISSPSSGPGKFPSLPSLSSRRAAQAGAAGIVRLDQATRPHGCGHHPCSGTISIAPQGHSAAHRPQPLQ